MARRELGALVEALDQHREAHGQGTEQGPEGKQVVVAGGVLVPLVGQVPADGIAQVGRQQEGEYEETIPRIRGLHLHRTTTNAANRTIRIARSTSGADWIAPVIGVPRHPWDGEDESDANALG